MGRLCRAAALISNDFDRARDRRPRLPIERRRAISPRGSRPAGQTSPFPASSETRVPSRRSIAGICRAPPRERAAPSTRRLILFGRASAECLNSGKVAPGETCAPGRRRRETRNNNRMKESASGVTRRLLTAPVQSESPRVLIRNFRHCRGFVFFPHPRHPPSLGLSPGGDIIASFAARSAELFRPHNGNEECADSGARAIVARAGL